MYEGLIDPGPSLDVVIPPYAEPVHLTGMKLHLRVDASAEDELIRAWTAAARSKVQAMTSSGVEWSTIPVAVKYRLILWQAPVWQYLQLPALPLISVESIVYVDANGATQTFDSSNYSVNPARGRIELAFNCYWPVVRGGVYGAMTVKFWSGIATPFTVSGATVTFLGRAPVTGERVRLVNSGGGLPATSAVETDYFVVGASSQTCGLSLTSGGSAITFTTAGTGTHFALLDLERFHAFTSAMKLLCGNWYGRREAVGEGIISEVPMAVQALASAARF